MRIEHKSEMVQKFAEVMLSDYYKQSMKREGLHRGDAISCPLKAYWRITGKIKPVYASQQVGTLLLGTIAHEILHKNFSAQEKEYNLCGIKVTVDAIFESDGKMFPVESKTTRKKIYRREDIPQQWIEQLAIAMGVMNVDKGYLVVLNVISFSLMVWEVCMSQEERETFIQGCIWQIGSILDAIEKNDPSILTPKYEECKDCPYKPTRTRQGCHYFKVLNK